MESTGIYWIPVWNILESMGFDLMLVNPYLIRQMPGRKSDVKDAQWIAELLYKGMLRGSLVPCPLIRELRTYSRKYRKLQQRLTSVNQEMERTLEMCNIRLTSLVSNITGKSVRRVVEALACGETDPEKLGLLVHGRIRNRHGANVRRSLEGFVGGHHRFTLSLLLEEAGLLERQCLACQEQMERICLQHYPQQIGLLVTHPGIDRLSAMFIIAETGADMAPFESSGRFSGWTGLRPRNDESAGKYKSTAITKGNRYLRTILVQIAWAATRTKGSHYREKYARMAMRKSNRKALIAVARKIGTVIWNMLAGRQPYNPALMPVYDPAKLSGKISYHQREIQRLEKILR